MAADAGAHGADARGDAAAKRPGRARSDRRRGAPRRVDAGESVRAGIDIGARGAGAGRGDARRDEEKSVRRGRGRRVRRVVRF